MKTKLNSWYVSYKLYRDKINHLLRKSKNNYYKEYFQLSKNNSKKIWNGINELLSKNKLKQTNINLYCDNNLITNQNIIAEKFNTFFTSIGPKLNNQIEDMGINFNKFMPPETSNSFYLSPTTPSEISLEITSLDDKTSSKIPIKVIKAASTEISIILSHIFNHSFITGTFPTSLKLAIVTPIHKSDSKTSVNNYRPISVPVAD